MVSFGHSAFFGLDVGAARPYLGQASQYLVGDPFWVGRPRNRRLRSLLLDASAATFTFDHDVDLLTDFYVIIFTWTEVTGARTG